MCASTSVAKLGLVQSKVMMCVHAEGHIRTVILVCKFFGGGNNNVVASAVLIVG